MTDTKIPTLNELVIASNERYLPHAIKTIKWFHEDFLANPFQTLELRSDLNMAVARHKVWSEIIGKISSGKETAQEIEKGLARDIGHKTRVIGDSNYLNKLDLALLQAMSEARECLRFDIAQAEVYVRWAENDAAKKAAAEAQEAA